MEIFRSESSSQRILYQVVSLHGESALFVTNFRQQPSSVAVMVLKQYVLCKTGAPNVVMVVPTRTLASGHWLQGQVKTMNKIGKLSAKIFSVV